MSRLPRRPTHHPSVAELVRKYQDYLPPQGVHDLAKTAFPPRLVVSESEQEYSTPQPNRNVVRSKSRHHQLTRRTSTSDFEQGYAANIAPIYLTRSRRSLSGQIPQNSRIPGPVGGVPLESRDSSRRPSPEKPSYSNIGSGRTKEVRFGRSSPPNTRVASATSSGGRGGKGKAPSVARSSRDKAPARPPTSVSNKSAFRRPTSGPGKVSNIAKHFERLGRDAERNKSRYTVIRGRRARPVASARAKVEILESIKDAIKDESESSDSSSEADDEGDDNDESGPAPGSIPQESSPESENMVSEVTVKTAPPLTSFPETIEEPTASTGLLELHVPTQSLVGPISLPPSPFLSSIKVASLTPPPSDFDLGPGIERHSILKALSGLWLQQPTTSQALLEADDIMSDPEHIFRDSSMIVRTDEPTSIIALALK